MAATGRAVYKVARRYNAVVVFHSAVEHKCPFNSAMKVLGYHCARFCLEQHRESLSL